MEMDRWLEERRASESRRRSTSHLCTPWLMAISQ
jgi:hypothetical protein